MGKRKVSLIGPSTLMVSLPSKWVKEFGVKKGDEINITENGPNLLLESQKLKKGEPYEIDLSDLNANLIRYNLYAAYRSGCDEIKLLFDEEKVILKVERSDRDELKDYLKRHNHINSLYRINNGYDFMFEAIFRNMKDLEDFIMSLEEQYKILNKHIYYVIDNIKQEDFLSRDDAIDIAFK